jgi:D-alanine-D-alanine ligase
MVDAILIRNGDKIDPAGILEKIGLPCFVKPNNSGSSCGVTKVKQKEELLSAIKTAFIEGHEVLIEAFMKGREVACGVLENKKKTIVLPVTEVISKNEFFDYEAKYTPGKSDEITPADLPAYVTNEIQRLSMQIFELLDCSGMVRVDFIVIDDKPFFLEINTVPGMTKESIVPKQAAAAGISLEDLYSMVVENMFE